MNLLDRTVGHEALRRGVPGASVVDQVARRLRGDYDIDEWGLDPELVSFANPLFALRWDVTVEGAERLPKVGGAVLVFNRRLGVSEPWVLARGIRRTTGRFVRTVGVPDLAPLGPAVRRFGGVLDRTDEIAGLLSAGQLVGLPTSRGLRARSSVGPLEVERLAAAVATGSPVVPVALIGRELGRSWRIVVGEAIEPRPDAGPLAAAELAESTRSAVQSLLDAGLPGSWW